VSEKHLDRYTRDYLQRLVDHKVVVSGSFLFINDENEKQLKEFSSEKISEKERL